MDPFWTNKLVPRPEPDDEVADENDEDEGGQARAHDEWDGVVLSVDVLWSRSIPPVWGCLFRAGGKRRIASNLAWKGTWRSFKGALE